MAFLERGSSNRTSFFLATTMTTYLRGPGQISPLVTINVLPNEVLLEIFDFCRVDVLTNDVSPYRSNLGIFIAPGIIFQFEPRDARYLRRHCREQVWPGPWREAWLNLFHVCQRWRYIMLSSPLRLHLHLYFTEGTPVRKVQQMLDVWPTFPISILSSNLGDNTIALLEHRDRISTFKIDINFDPTCSQLERFVKVTQEPFPGLTSLHISSEFEPEEGTVSVVPDTFLKGFAPRLRSLTLTCIPFPTLPQLVSSLNDLSELILESIPNLGYFSPEAIVTGLSASTKLRTLYIQYEESLPVIPHPNPNQTRPPRTVLPALTEFQFMGGSEYLDDLLARVDFPQLERFNILFIQRQDVFDSDIRQVIHHSRMLGSFSRAEVNVSRYSVGIQLYQPEGTNPPRTVELEINNELEGGGWQYPVMTQLCNRSLSLLSSITELRILTNRSFPHFDLLDDTGWPELFRLLTAVHTLRLSGIMQSRVIYWLRALDGESATDVLPALRNLYVDKYPKYVDPGRKYVSHFLRESIQPFIAARQHSGQPVKVYLVA
jgi:hypothetical protein